MDRAAGGGEAAAAPRSVVTRRSPLAPDRWRRASELFDRLADLGPPARERELASIAATDPDLAAELRRLLAADAGSHQLLDQPLGLAAPTEPAAAARERTRARGTVSRRRPPRPRRHGRRLRRRARRRRLRAAGRHQDRSPRPRHRGPARALPARAQHSGATRARGHRPRDRRWSARRWSPLPGHGARRRPADPSLRRRSARCRSRIVSASCWSPAMRSPSLTAIWWSIAISSLPT